MPDSSSWTANKSIALLVASLLSIVIGWWFDGSLPGTRRLLPEISTEPLQTGTATPPFSVSVNKVDYRIKPLFDYDISGLVVSKHDADTWWDWIHKAWNDELNAVDLCVIWGVNAADGAYRKMSFSSGQFVCYFQTSSAEAAQPKYFRALSNNHLLTDEPHIARQLRNVRVGDQIRIRGQLAEYSHDAGFAFMRGSSISRDDTGNGACETIFVRDISVLRGADAWPRWLFRLGLLGVLLSVGLWIAAPQRSWEE